nr:hypothetical protein [uncultured Rhodopila sp.]
MENGVTANPHISKITGLDLSGTGFLTSFLYNAGTSVLPTGSVIAKQKSKDGTVESLRIYNRTPLSPGETTKLVQEVFGAFTITVLSYVGSDGSEYPLNQFISRSLFGWSVR